MSADALRQRTRSFIEQLSPRARARPLGDEEPLMDRGVVDSFGVIEIVAWMEREFRIEVTEDDLILGNFESIRRISELIARKLDGGADGGGSG